VNALFPARHLCDTAAMSDVDWQALFLAAESARRAAYAPFSRFQVGAALLCDGGQVVRGCNVENASFGLTVCAERNAVGAMVVAGSKRAVAVALVVDSKRPTPPCGMCRQVLAEFGEAGLVIASRTLGGVEAQWTLGELLPHQFGREFL
jgi:cytidine deaminase